MIEYKGNNKPLHANTYKPDTDNGKQNGALSFDLFSENINEQSGDGGEHQGKHIRIHQQSSHY